MKKRFKKIGEILIESGFVDQQKIDEALQYQSEVGGNITQYLIERNYIKEEDLAKCISVQFGCPYLPLRAYEISSKIAEIIPAEIAEKYWVMPVDKIGNILTVVMANPLDEEAVGAIEKATGCYVQPFVGILSDIAKAIEHYYDISLEDEVLAAVEKKAPLFIKVPSYKGEDRRKAIRIKCRLNVHFVDPNIYHRANYVKVETKDISKTGFLFESANILPLDSFLNLGFHLPENVNPYPIHAVVQVIRVAPLKSGRFDVGVKIMSIKKSDINKILKYSLTMVSNKNDFKKGSIRER